MKRLGVFLLPLDGMVVQLHRRVTPSSKFAGTHLYTWVERGTMGVKCLAQEHNTVPRPGLEPGPFYPESSALTIRPPRLPPRLFRPSPFRFTLRIPGHGHSCGVFPLLPQGMSDPFPLSLSYRCCYILLA